jgi:uncharacterized BrkB/YihY/UPF0761 family membrane protein
MELYQWLIMYLAGVFWAVAILYLLYKIGPPDEAWPWHYAWGSWIFLLVWMIIIYQALRK